MSDFEAKARARCARIAEAFDVSRETSAETGIEARDVSRETLCRLDAFVAELGRWNARINLISKNELQRVWSRHVLDSLGLTPALAEAERWIDLGSGGGFPAVPLAIVARAAGLGVGFELFESDQRKSAFLRHVGRDLDLPISVIAERIEAAAPRRADVISARALAPVKTLLGHAAHLVPQGARLALLKGPQMHDELTDAARSWHIRYQSERHPITLERNILWLQGFWRG